MNFLPEEILIDIFEYCSESDLIALSTVCRAFNNAISNSKLVQKLHLSFRKLNGDEETIGNRRYSQLKIGFFKPTSHYWIIKSIGRNFTTLSFANHKLKIESIRKILVETKNVITLTFDRVLLSDVPTEMKQPHPRLDLRCLTSIVSDHRLFRVFISSTVRKLEVTQAEDDDFVYPDLRRFLRLQDKLTDLSLVGFCKTNLFTDTSLISVKCKLQRFSIKDCIFSMTIHLKDFLANHVESLEELELVALDLCDLSTLINQMRNLRSLKLLKVQLNYLETLPNVEELAVSGNKVSEIMFDKVPNVKRLSLSQVRNKRVLIEISENLTQVESLELVEGSLQDLAIPSLKKLSLSRAGACPTGFFELHCNIEHLSLQNCQFITDETISEIAHSLGNLKSLKITLADKSEISNKSLEVIRDNCKLLREISIKHHKDKLDWTVLESRREMTIVI